MANPDQISPQQLSLTLNDSLMKSRKDHIALKLPTGEIDQLLGKAFVAKHHPMIQARIAIMKDSSTLAKQMNDLGIKPVHIQRAVRRILQAEKDGRDYKPELKTLRDLISRRKKLDTIGVDVSGIDTAIAELLEVSEERHNFFSNTNMHRSQSRLARPSWLGVLLRNLRQRLAMCQAPPRPPTSQNLQCQSSYPKSGLGPMIQRHSSPARMLLDRLFVIQTLAPPLSARAWLPLEDGKTLAFR